MPGLDLTDEEVDAATCAVCGAKPCTLFCNSNGSPWVAFCEDHGPDDMEVDQS